MNKVMHIRNVEGRWSMERGYCITIMWSPEAANISDEEEYFTILRSNPSAFVTINEIIDANKEDRKKLALLNIRHQYGSIKWVCNNIIKGMDIILDPAVDTKII